MRIVDMLHFSWEAIIRYRFRSSMVLLAIAFGVAAVVVLTALGEGARRYVLGEFAFLGKDVLVIFPGKNETTGGLPPVMGSSARDITLEDMHVLSRRLSAIEDIAPVVVGSAEVSYQQRAREVIVLGSTGSFVDIRQLTVGRGRNLQIEDFRRASDECLIGAKLRKELMPAGPVVGETVRVADYRCRIVGELLGRGDAFGMDLSDSLIISVAAAQRLYNTEALFRVMVRIRPGYSLDNSREQLLRTMAELHQGEEDITVVSPDALLSTFDDVFQVLTLGVGAIGGVSLLVAGVLIMNITLISVSQRTREIGLLKALGATSASVLRLILIESLLMTSLGALAGLLVGGLVVWLGRALFPDIAFATPLWAILAAFSVALLSGLLFAWMPARRASRLVPVAALQHRGH